MKKTNCVASLKITIEVLEAEIPSLRDEGGKVGVKDTKKKCEKCINVEKEKNENRLAYWLEYQETGMGL
ncbi:hypothetical protein J6590_062074 [Homalodisca vitripennis]|nr:hypothetical protein J6590_062074 [Homalodisca vitripennis]